MNKQFLGPLIYEDELNSELNRRKKQDIFKSVSGSTKKLIDEKVRLEELEGWRTARENLKSTRMAKAKPADEQFEDEVWCILARMGFKEMSKGRQFTIKVETGLPPRQIDVFAKDDETVMIVECTRRDIHGKKNMVSLIEKIKANREGFNNAIRKTYENLKKLKIKYVIATRNIEWREVDLKKCKDAQIAVITDSEIDYYGALVQHLKQAARYQFLGHMLSGQKVIGLTRKVLATRGKMGGEVFYSFLMKPDDLLKIAYVGHKASRDIENLATYQRMLQPSRLRKIAEYINAGGRFPTNIVVNLKTTKKTNLRFDIMKKVGQEALGVLYLPQNYASAWVIDGQHRLYGYAHARDKESFNQDTTSLPVLAYDNLSADKEMNLFIDINSKQVKVATGLLVELYSDLHWNSSDPDEAFQALLSRMASYLNFVQSSPLYDRMVVSGKKKTKIRCLTQTSIRDGLKVSGLLGTADRVGPLSTESVTDYEANLKKGFSIISNSLRMFSNQLENHWEIGDGVGGYLCTNNGIRALFHVIKDIANHVQQEFGFELYLLDSDETSEELEPYLKELVNFFWNASSHDIQMFRKLGSSLAAVRQQAYGMEAQIHSQIPEFNPAGLQDYLDSRDEDGTQKARSQIYDIQKRIFDYVINALKNNYGTENKKWWIEGVPLNIRKDCTQRWEEKNRNGKEEEQLYLKNYVDICIKNWHLVKDVISLGAKDKIASRLNTKWIKELNDIRNKVSHPEQGVLDVNQVAWVKEIYDKVEEHFP